MAHLSLQFVNQCGITLWNTKTHGGFSFPCPGSHSGRGSVSKRNKRAERHIAFFMFKFQNLWCKFKGERDALILYDIRLPLLTVLSTSLCNWMFERQPLLKVVIESEVKTHPLPERAPPGTSVSHVDAQSDPADPPGSRLIRPPGRMLNLVRANNLCSCPSGCCVMWTAPIPLSMARGHLRIFLYVHSDQKREVKLPWVFVQVAHHTRSHT